jgi:hypothetical protein
MPQASHLAFHFHEESSILGARLSSRATHRPATLGSSPIKIERTGLLSFLNFSNTGTSGCVWVDPILWKRYPLNPMEAHRVIRPVLARNVEAVITNL